MLPITPLFRPMAFYREFEPSLLEGLVAVFVTALVVSLSLLGVGLFAGGSVASNLTLSDPVHPSASICASDSVGQASTGCTVPATTGFFVDNWGAVSGWTPLVFAGVFVVWLLAAVALYALAAVPADDVVFGDVLAVAAWGVVPLAAEALTTLALVGASFGQQSLSGPLATALTTVVVGGSVIRPFVSMGAAVWQGYVWAAGVYVVTDLRLVTASAAGGVVAALTVVFGGL